MPCTSLRLSGHNSIAMQYSWGNIERKLMPKSAGLFIAESRIVVLVPVRRQNRVSQFGGSFVVASLDRLLIRSPPILIYSGRTEMELTQRGDAFVFWNDFDFCHWWIWLIISSGFNSATNESSGIKASGLDQLIYSKKVCYGRCLHISERSSTTYELLHSLYLFFCLILKSIGYIFRFIIFAKIRRIRQSVNKFAISLSKSVRLKKSL